MGKFKLKLKHGDRVKCKIEGVGIDDAKISIDSGGTPYICQNKKEGSLADDLLGYTYSWRTKNDFTGFGVTNLRHAGKTLDNLQEGDVVKNEDGEKREILGVCGRVVFLSIDGDMDRTSLASYTKEELIERGYKIVQEQEEEEEEVEEITVEELCKERGHKVKIVK